MALAAFGVAMTSSSPSRSPSVTSSGLSKAGRTRRNGPTPRGAPIWPGMAAVVVGMGVLVGLCALNQPRGADPSVPGVQAPGGGAGRQLRAADRGPPQHVRHPAATDVPRDLYDVLKALGTTWISSPGRRSTCRDPHEPSVMWGFTAGGTRTRTAMASPASTWPMGFREGQCGRVGRQAGGLDELNASQYEFSCTGSPPPARRLAEGCAPRRRREPAELQGIARGLKRLCPTRHHGGNGRGITL